MSDARRAAPLLRREVSALQRGRTLQDPGTTSSSSVSPSSTARRGVKSTFLGDPERNAQALAMELSGRRTDGSSKKEEKMKKKKKKKKMTMSNVEVPEKVAVSDRIKRIEESFGSTTNTLSGELRKEGLIKELKERGRIPQDREVAERWEEGTSSMSQLLGMQYGSGRAALFAMVDDDDDSNHGESLFQTDEDELSPMEREMMRRAKLNPASPLHLASLSRVGKEPELKPPRHRRRSAAHVVRSRNPIKDDELDFTELPCFDWYKRGGGKESRSEQIRLPVQSISSLDSDANALPLIIGEDAHEDMSDNIYEESPKKASVKDVPVVTPPRCTLTQKYRPKHFRDLVGQSVVVKSLHTAIIKRKVAPVYLFSGPRGTGKMSAARVFAAGLNCEHLDYSQRPCVICRQCALAQSADVQEIDAAAKPELEALRTAMGSFQPAAGRYKVFIVEGCDSLGAEIWNAFLKILEELPVDVVFILITTDANHIPATPTLRCQKFHFAKLKEAEIVSRLETLARAEELEVEDGALAFIAARSDGSLRDAETVLDQVCLLDKTVSVALVRELVGLLPDAAILELLDYALSADTINTVRALREVLACGVEPLSLFAQLVTLITDILAGSFDVHRELRHDGGFFNRKFSVKEEHHRLRQALKTLSESEKQLRVASDRATWLTAALLQFAPDRSFLPSEAEYSPERRDFVEEEETATTRPQRSDVNEPEHQAQFASSSMESGRQESSQRRDPMEEEETATEQKLEEAWSRELPQQQQQQQQDEPETSRGASSLEFDVFRDEALIELYTRVLREITSRSLKHLLYTQGRLVAAGVAVDGSCSVVELEFDYPREKLKAERSWRSICLAFQAVLRTAMELRIALSERLPEEEELPTLNKKVPSEEEAPSRGGHRRQRREKESTPGGITPRRLPPRRRRKKRISKQVEEMERLPSSELTSFGGDEMWHCGHVLAERSSLDGNHAKSKGLQFEEEYHKLEEEYQKLEEEQLGPEDDDHDLSLMSFMNLSLTENEIVLPDSTQILECPTSSSHNLSSEERENLVFIITLQKELAKMDNICTESSNHETLSSLLHKEAGTIIFCCYDTNENQFEFYFKDSQDMASIVGVGLEHAKAILDKGCKIKVKEISKMEWEQTLSLVQSSATSVFKSFKLELPRSGVIEGDTNFTGRPLLWDLAKYFILQEITTLLANHTNGASSSIRPNSSEKFTSSNVTKLFRDFMKLLHERINGRDDDEDGEKHEPKGGLPPGPNHPAALEGNCNTIVTIELLAGGKIVNARKASLGEQKEQVLDFEVFDGKTKERLKGLDEGILPNLEFKFEKHDGIKTIRSTIGQIRFNLDAEDKWLHCDLRVSFGLYGLSTSYGKVERFSFEQLDLDPSLGTESTKNTRILASREGYANGTSIEGSAKPVGLGGAFKSASTNSTDNTDSRQYEAGRERKCNFTRGGLGPKMFESKHMFGCQYYSLDSRPYQELSALDPLRCSQDVKFQGLWNVIDIHPQPHAASFADYELVVCRSLEELPLDKSDGKSKGINLDSKLAIASRFRRLWRSPKIASEKRHVRYQWKFNQVYEKKILLNHGMTHLDGRHHNLDECLKVFGGAFLADKGKSIEYIWPNGCAPLVTMKDS